MARKTITLELYAYEKLKRAKHSPRESFSSVVRRAVFTETSWRASEPAADIKRLIEERRPPAIDEEALDRLNAAQERPRRSFPET